MITLQSYKGTIPHQSIGEVLISLLISRNTSREAKQSSGCEAKWPWLGRYTVGHPH